MLLLARKDATSVDPSSIMSLKALLGDLLTISGVTFETFCAWNRSLFPSE
jgi:hypothetical protein